MTSHKKIILAHLKRGARMTKIQALKMFGCWNVGGRICELRAEGHNIITIMIEKTNKKGVVQRYAEYHLEK